MKSDKRDLRGDQTKHYGHYRNREEQVISDLRKSNVDLIKEPKRSGKNGEEKIKSAKSIRSERAGVMRHDRT